MIIYIKIIQKILLEGLDIGDYVSLYDHPDKYVNSNEIRNNCQGNPKIIDNSEQTRVYLSDSAHWKLTNILTFASNIRILKEDYIDILKFCSGTFHMIFMFHKFDRKKINN